MPAVQLVIKAEIAQLAPAHTIQAVQHALLAELIVQVVLKVRVLNV